MSQELQKLLQILGEVFELNQVQLILGGIHQKCDFFAQKRLAFLDEKITFLVNPGSKQFHQKI